MLSVLASVAYFVVFCRLQNIAVMGEATPEQIHLALGKTPATMVVSWVTMEKMEEKPALVEYGIGSTNEQAVAETEKFKYKHITRHMHRAEISVKPQSTYVYRVGGYGAWSQQYSFRTFPSGNNFSFKVAIFGDLGYLNGTSLPYLIADARHQAFDMIIHVGDIAYNLHSKHGTRGDLYMNQIEPMAAIMPYMVIAGNHENDKKNFSHYQNRFNMPNVDNQFYSFEVGPVHFTGLSTELYAYATEYGAYTIRNQAAWVNEDLAAANANRDNVPWIMSYLHRPIYCSNTNSDECEDYTNDFIRNGLGDLPGVEPMFATHGVDVAFFGHEHSYERLFPVINRTVYNTGANPYHNAPAPTYIVTGSAGCHTPHSPFGDPSPASAFRSEDFGYTVMTVHNHTHVQLQQISVEKGGPIDEIWIIKDLGYRMSTKGRTGLLLPQCDSSLP